MNIFIVWKMKTHIIYINISEVMNLFVMQVEYTYYLRVIDILGYEHFWSCRR